jgi:hypothetical protein
MYGTTRAELGIHSVVSLSAASLTNLLIGLAVLGWILYRQLQARPAKTDMRLPLILAVIGIIQLTRFLHGTGQHHTGLVFIALAGSLLIAVVLGAVRAATTRVWMHNGQMWRQGSWLTALLWIVSIGLHLGYDWLVEGSGTRGLGNATLTLYLAITYAVQRLVIQTRLHWIDRSGNDKPSTTL